MICYKDKTFCIAECSNRECTYKYTSDVRKAAKEWWGNDDFPVALADRSEGCDSYICPECTLIGGLHKMDCSRG